MQTRHEDTRQAVSAAELRERALRRVPGGGGGGEGRLPGRVEFEWYYVVTKFLGWGRGYRVTRV